jgi:hypothetical protein
MPPGLHGWDLFFSFFVAREMGRTADLDLYFGLTDWTPINKRRDPDARIWAGDAIAINEHEQVPDPD